MNTGSSHVSSLVHLVPLVFLVLALGMLLVGWRGRRVGRSPVCRRCGFDLTGRPETSTVCAECGSELSAPGAIRTGHHRRRRGLLWTGATVLLLGVAWIAVAGYVLSRQLDLNPYKPVWLLTREFVSGDPLVRRPAATELLLRLGNGRLGKGQIDNLTSKAIAFQGDRSRTWDPAWGNVVEGARAAGHLSDDAWARYARQAPQIGLEVRPAQDRGAASLPYWIVHAAARVGDSSSLALRNDSRGMTIWVSDVELPDENGWSLNTGGLSANGNGKSGRGIELKPVLGRLKDGPQTLRMKGTVDLIDGRAGDTGSTPAIAQLPIDLTVPWVLEPADRPTVTLNKDPSHRPGVEGGLVLDRVRIEPGSSQQDYLQSSVTVRGVPVGVGYRVVARRGDREWPLGTFACPAGTTNHSFGMGNQVKEPLPETVDVVFIPDRETAARTTNTFEIWDGEIVIKDVKVERPTPSTAPAAN